MTSSSTKVALVMPVYNRREITLQGLRSLSRIDTAGLDVCIFVVDDGSTDGTSDAIGSYFPDTVVIEGTGNLHYAGGTNMGIREALKWDPAYLVLMNDDAVFHEQFLQRLIRTAMAEAHSVIGALLLLWDEPHRVLQVNHIWKTWKGGWQMPTGLTAFDLPSEPFEVEGIVGNCVLLPVEAVHECGLMDEKKFPYGWGDAQYMMRVKKAGWRLLVDPKAYVWCEPNTYPPPLHTLQFRDALKILLVNERHPLNLKRQFMARWESAPGKLHAFVAFLIYCAMLCGKAAKGIGFRITHSVFGRKSDPG